MGDGIVFTAKVLRKQAELPRYIVVKPEHVPGRTEAFEADLWLNGAGPFPRMIRPWGKGSAAWFFNLTAVQCRKAGLETGDVCEVRIVPRG